MILGAIDRADEEESLLFLNKKKQKNLVNLLLFTPAICFQPHRIKIFASFFKKKTFFFT